MLIFNKIKVNKLFLLDSGKNKIWMGWIALIFIVLHFGFIINSALPETVKSSRIERVSAIYVDPIFTQQWALFAPCPTINTEIEAKYYFENDSTNWIKLGENAKKMHSYFRGSHHGELMIGESNIAHWFIEDIYEMGIQDSVIFPANRMSEFHKGHSYYKIKSYLSGYSTYLYSKQAKSARIRFLMTDVTTGQFSLMELPLYSFK